MASPEIWDFGPPAIDDCLSRTRVALLASFERLAASESATRIFDAADIRMRQQLAAQKILLCSELKPV